MGFFVFKNTKICIQGDISAFRAKLLTCESINVYNVINSKKERKVQMDKLLNHIMAFLYQNEEINEEQSEIVRYGLEIVILKVVFLITTLIVGIFMKSFWECLTFMILFMPLRSYAGGYHAQTRIQCFVQSMLTVTIVIGLLKVIDIYISVPLFILSLISLPFIWILAPVDTKNKRLDQDERKSFRRKTRIVLIVEITAAIVFYVLGQDIYIGLKTITYTAALTICDVTLLVIMEHIKNRKMEK